MKLYSLLEEAHELDDYCVSTTFYPIYFSLDLNKVIEQFNKKISFYLNHPDIFEIDKEETKENCFCCYSAKWIYRWKIVEYELEKNLTYDNSQRNY